MPYFVDESQWPLVVLRMDGSVTDEEELEFCALTAKFSGRGVRYTVILDALNAATPSPRFMRMQAKAQKRCAEGIRAHCDGIAFVIRSPMIRGALRAILHLQSLPCRQVVVATVEEARAWTTEQMATSG